MGAEPSSTTLSVGSPRREVGRAPEKGVRTPRQLARAAGEVDSAGSDAQKRRRNPFTVGCRVVTVSPQTSPRGSPGPGTTWGAARVHTVFSLNK